MSSFSFNHVILCAGGTGGHLFPATATAKELKKLYADIKVTLMTDKGELKDEESFGVVHHHIKRRQSGVRSIAFVLTLIASFFKSLFFYLQTKPTLVVGFGGYPSVPMVLAAQFLKIPTLLHEQNAYLGKSNRYLSKRAQAIALSFPKTEAVPARIKTFLCGNPVRLTHHPSYDVYELSFEKIRLTILGGSQGAAIFSDVIPKAFALLSEKERNSFVVTQQCREELLEETTKKYQSLNMLVTLQPFFYNMDDLYQKTDVVISRSGASTLFEILKSRRPAFLVPYPHAMDNHQYYNALYLKDASWLCLQKDLTDEKLAEFLRKINAETNDLKEKAQKLKSLSFDDAATTLARIIKDLLPI